MKLSLIWKFLFVLFSLSMAILFLEKSWDILIYSLTYVLVYGSLIFYFRQRIRSTFSKISKWKFPVFIAIGLLVSIFEEIYVYSLGNKIAVSSIWLDIVVVPLEWAAWFATWYLLISRRYHFTESQALLTAGLTGILFEFSGKGFLVSDPLAIIVFFPSAIFVYAAIFILPMQLIDFTGSRNSWVKYPIGIFVPYLASIPVGLLLYFTLIH